MNIIVYGKTAQIASMRLQSMLDDMKYGDILKVRKSINNMAVELKNGDYYTTAITSDNSRGTRCQIAYVPENVDQEFLDNIVYPCLIGEHSEVRYY